MNKVFKLRLIKYAITLNRFLIIAAGSLLLVVNTLAIAAPGDLDTSFGMGTGRIEFDIGRIVYDSTYDSLRSLVAIQADNKIVVATKNNDFVVNRYNVSGELDFSFGNGGSVVFDFGGDDVPRALAIQADGKIVVAGTKYFSNGEEKIIIARFRSDGTLDSEFAGEGFIIAEIDGRLSSMANAMALQIDGKILVAGEVYSEPNNAVRSMIVLRYTNKGSLDNSFDGDGIFKPDNLSGSWAIKSIALQTNNKIVVGGVHDKAFFTARLHRNGSFDRSYNNSGIAIKNITSQVDAGYAIALQPNNAVVVAGYSGEIDTQANGTDLDLAVLRYRSNGRLDTSFDRDGMVTTDVTAMRGEGIGGLDIGHSVLVQPNEKIIVAGESGTHHQNYWSILRYQASGILDGTFNRNGLVINRGSHATSIALQADGKILVAGIDRTNDASNSANDDSEMILMRYHGDITDLEPAPFSFRDLFAVRAGSIQTSNEIIVSGLTPQSYAPVRIRGGVYSINGRAFTSLPGWVKNGDKIRLRHTASKRSQTGKHTTLTLGGLHAPNNPTLVIGNKKSDTFTSVTQ